MAKVKRLRFSDGDAKLENEVDAAEIYKGSHGVR